MSDTYKIVRKFSDDSIPERVIHEGLTEGEARAHTNDPTTSSSTTTSAWGRELTDNYGPWMDVSYPEDL